MLSLNRCAWSSCRGPASVLGFGDETVDETDLPLLVERSLVIVAVW